MAFTAGEKWQWSMRCATAIIIGFLWASVYVSAERNLKGGSSKSEDEQVVEEPNYPLKLANLFWPPNGLHYQHVWPQLTFGWNTIVGSIIGFFGAAIASFGGVGGGGIFVPMLTLIIGFDVKSSTAISKCMITGIAGSILFYKLKMRHPTLDLPIIDYDLALLFQPMLMLGVSIGIYLNVIFHDWMIIFLLTILSLGTAANAFSKGIDTWKKETIIMREAAHHIVSNGGGYEVAYKPLPDGQCNVANEEAEAEVSILQNIIWKDFCLFLFVWIAFLTLQIIKSHTTTCSTWYWVLNFLQVPVAVGVTLYEAINLYRGKRVIASKGELGTNWRVDQLVHYCICGIFAGIAGGLLGLGGGFILAPLFLELGVPPQVSSATATFIMAFSSSLSIAEYYLLERFPVPDAIYFVVVATIAALVGQLVVRRLFILLGRLSLIIFVLAFMISISAISFGVFGVVHMLEKIQRHEYIGFEDRCNY